MEMDKARKKTDKKLAEMESDIADIYEEARSDITKKWNAYMERGEKRLSALRESGDKQAYQTALTNFTLKNAWYQDMVNTTITQLAHTNEIALAYVKDQMPEIYALNYNQFGEELQKAERLSDENIRFNLVDEATVKRMIKDGDIEMPNQEKRLKIPKDKRWNTKQINSSVLQGIIKGESIPDIAKRLTPIMDNNRSAAIRNARTLTTGAECRGRLDSYKQAESDGIVMNKVWMATPDGRTRDWHIDMDGQEVGVDEEFIDGLGNYLEYPGDPGGAPETVYNCRCTMTTHIIGFRKDDGSISYIDFEYEEGGLHQKQISEEFERRGIERSTQRKQVREESVKIENTIKFSDARSATEYFRGETYDSKLGSTGYGIRENDNKSATKWKNKLTYNQEVYITGYTGNDYEPINNYLRGLISKKEAQNDLSIGDVSSIDKRIKYIDDGIKKFDLKDPITVYRTCEREFLKQLKEGDVFHDNGYGSTSVLSIPVASGDVFMEIDVPAGKGIGAYVDGVSWKEGEEYEFLLGRGANYFVESIIEKEDGIHVKATIKDFTR